MNLGLQSTITGNADDVLVLSGSRTSHPIQGAGSVRAHLRSPDQCADLDNLNIHRAKSLADAYGAEMAAEVGDRFTIHYTPKHGSWLNQAEIEIGIFSRQCLGNRRIPDLKTLERGAKAWNRRMNRDRVKIAWKFDRKTARRKFGYKRNRFTRSKTYCLPGDRTGTLLAPPNSSQRRATFARAS